MKYALLSFFLFASIAVFSQRNTAHSMYLKKDKNTQLDFIESKSGNLFTKLGHHGPAIEN